MLVDNRAEHRKLDKPIEYVIEEGEVALSLSSAPHHCGGVVYAGEI